METTFENSDVNDFDNEVRYRLTPKGIMYAVLHDYNISVSIRLAGAITNDFIDLMKRHGYIEDSAGM